MTRSRLSVLLLAAAAAIAVTLVVAMPAGPPANAATASGFNHTITNYGNGKCLQPANQSMDQGAPIVQEPCNGSLAQDWAFLTLGGNRDRMLNHLSGLCIDAQGDAVNGTPIVQWTCATISNETFDTGRPLPDIVALTSRVSGTASHCLDVPGAQAVDGLAVQLYACNGTVAQTWLVGVGIVIQP